MSKHGKKYRELQKKAPNTELTLTEAIKAVKKNSYSKFNGTVELHIAINVPKDKDAKSLKGSVVLPYSTEKKIKIAVFTTEDKVEEAKKAGAEKAGLEDLIKEIKDGKIDFDLAIATPEIMPKIAVLGKELGPKGLMPNPRTGTVTNDIAATIAEYKKGKQNIVCDESGVLHFAVGKLDFDDEKILENIKVCYAKVTEIVGKPIKQVLKSVAIAPTMGKGVKVIYSEE